MKVSKWDYVGGGDNGHGGDNGTGKRGGGRGIIKKTRAMSAKITAATTTAAATTTTAAATTATTAAKAKKLNKRNAKKPLCEHQRGKKLVLLYASVESLGVSRMRDYFFILF